MCDESHIQETHLYDELDARQKIKLISTRKYQITNILKFVIILSDVCNYVNYFWLVNIIISKTSIANMDLKINIIFKKM